MRACAFALAFPAALSAAMAFGHGPQIQITNDAGKIVTRELILDGPYSNSLTAAKSVYVMPVLEFNGVWYSRPNGAIDPNLGAPAFPSGPGLAYGHDLADGGPQQFAAGSILALHFADGFKRWNGAAFLDAGATELKAFRGSNVNISSPPENFAITSDSAPFDSVQLPAVAANYGSGGPEVHNSLRFALWGDGATPLSPVMDGIYVASLKLSSTQVGLAASDPFYFVLHKNAAWDAIAGAVSTLGIQAAQVQWLAVPEPCSISIGVGTLVLTVCVRWRMKRS